MALNSMGAIAIEQKDLDRAWKLLEASLAIRREIGQEAGLPTPLTNLGIIALERGEYDQAEELFEESLAIDRKMHNQAEVAVGLSHLALIQQMRGNYTRARALYQDSLRMLQEFADLEGIADCLEGLAVSLIGLSPTPDQALHAARLFGAAEMQRENIQVPLREVESARLVTSIATSKEQLGEIAFQQAWSEGRAMSLQNVLDYVQDNI
jgi:tetratricopeptide (TPR) repeat protein